ncbi:NUDIX domain-containing protein [Halobacillus litoralis]|uniref:NUDIX domain-containing protein n=1 Tax=Halobacillus litoralis TaxID=45668 RepID=A0A845FDC4_9BACI|nr:NUDIX hydrolase [Halobacillus litoralis]MYL72403.1 NUDIX domain-containing protein [Halobacillus litoralis]
MEYVKELRKEVGTRPLILPGAVVIIVNDQQKILLQHRKDGGWGLPGGLMELGESLEETARREVKEETGLHVGELELLDIFSGEDYFFKISNGDELYSVTAVYRTDEYKGKVEVDEEESHQITFFSINHLPADLTKEYRDYLQPHWKKQR